MGNLVENAGSVCGENHKNSVRLGLATKIDSTVGVNVEVVGFLEAVGRLLKVDNAALAECAVKNGICGVIYVNADEVVNVIVDNNVCVVCAVYLFNCNTVYTGLDIGEVVLMVVWLTSLRPSA